MRFVHALMHADLVGYPTLWHVGPKARTGWVIERQRIVLEPVAVHVHGFRIKVCGVILLCMYFIMLLKLAYF